MTMLVLRSKGTADFYVYRLGKLGIRTNVPPARWKGKVDAFLNACPEGYEIYFNIKRGKPVEVSRNLLEKEKAKPSVPYDKLPLLPNILAETVCGEPYTGRELSNPAGYYVKRIEAARQKMTPDDVREFADLCDRRCRAAYEAGGKWFLKVVKAKDCREQLKVWLIHWLASYLHDPDSLRSKVK